MALTVDCPACSKRLPGSARFCAYCGAALPARAQSRPATRPGFGPPPFAWPQMWPRSLPALPRFSTVLALVGAATGCVAGGMLGTLLGDTMVGALMGAGGVATSAALADGLGVHVNDRRSAERLGRVLGVLGGASSLAAGPPTAVLVALWHGAPADLRGWAALAVGGLYLGLFCALAGAASGVALGVLVGRYPPRAGWMVARRGGAVVAAALVWTLSAVLGGVFAGDYAGRITGADRVDSALLGLVMQVAVGLAVLAGSRRVLDRALAWRPRWRLRWRWPWRRP